MSSTQKYRISIIEPSLLVSEGLKTVFQSQHEFEILHCYSGLPQFLERPVTTRPDIVLINPIVIDFQRQHNIKTIFSSYNQTLLIAIIYQFIEQDLLKQYHGSITVFDDGNKISKKLHQALKESQQKQEVNDNFELSEREIEILVSVVKGLQNKEIADLHHISIHTVISHRKNISRKTGIKSVAGLTVYALLHQLLDRDDIE